MSKAIRKHPRLYCIWKAMRARCNNKNTSGYKHYGGRGIKVCKEWNESSIPFIEWALNNGYKDGLTIDRKDSDGDYCPENCRWVNWSVQARNKKHLKPGETGIVGVIMDKGKYTAQIYVQHQRVFLGRYDTIEEAAEARKKGEAKYWGNMR